MDEVFEDWIFLCRKVGFIMWEGRDRVVNFVVEKIGRIFVCYGIDFVLELFCIFFKEEI